MMEELAKEVAQMSLAEAKARGDLPRPGEVYRHYKGGLYTVVCVSIHEATLEPLVTYHSNRKGSDWTRTLANFTGEAAGLPRFTRESD